MTVPRNLPEPLDEFLEAIAGGAISAASVALGAGVAGCCGFWNN